MNGLMPALGGTLYTVPIPDTAYRKSDPSGVTGARFFSRCQRTLGKPKRSPSTGPKADS